MVSREHKREALHERLQLLRSITNSHAVNKTSIIVDTTKHIEQLKDKVERLHQETTASSSQSSATSCNQDSSLLLPEVTVETTDKGVLVNVFVEKSLPGLLVSVLEAFEELNLNVIEARVSCADSFRFEAIGGENKEQGESVDAEVVRQTLLLAIRQWT